MTLALFPLEGEVCFFFTNLQGPVIMEMMPWDFHGQALDDDIASTWHSLETAVLRPSRHVEEATLANSETTEADNPAEP